MKKRYIFFIIIFIIIFLFFYYKNLKAGNNIINLNKEKIIENILTDELNYKSKVKVIVYSNKNQNEYNLRIEENGENNLTEIIGNSKNSGLIIEKKNKNLFVKNTKLKLNKIYEKYHEITDNSLFLSSFVKDYKNSNNRKIFEEDDKIVVKIKLKDYTKYIKFKELKINKNTGLPSELIIKDSSNNVKIFIKYTSIELF